MNFARIVLEAICCGGLFNSSCDKETTRQILNNTTRPPKILTRLLFCFRQHKYIPALRIPVYIFFFNFFIPALIPGAISPIFYGCTYPVSRLDFRSSYLLMSQIKRSHNQLFLLSSVKRSRQSQY